MIDDGPDAIASALSTYADSLLSGDDVDQVLMELAEYVIGLVKKREIEWEITFPLKAYISEQLLCDCYDDYGEQRLEFPCEWCKMVKEWK